MPNKKIATALLGIGLGTTAVYTIIVGRKVHKKIKQINAKFHAAEIVTTKFISGGYGDEFSDKDLRRDYQFYKMTYMFDK